MFISHKYGVIFVHIQRTGGNSVQKIFEEFDPDLLEAIQVDPSRHRTKHCYASDIQESIDSDIFKSYTKFSIVRNPFDRLVSWYSMFKYGFDKDDPIMKVDNNAKSLDLYYKGIRFLNGTSFSKKAWLLKYWTNFFRLFKNLEVNDLEETAVRHTTIGASVMVEIQKNANNFEEFILMPRDHGSGLFERFYVNQLDYLAENGQLLVDQVLRFENLGHDFNHLAQTIGFEGRLPHINKSTREANYQSYYNAMTQEVIYQRFKRDFDYFGYHF